MTLESIPAYWAGPISTIVVVLGSILLLYPLVWKLTIKQLAAALKAVDTAKELPELASKIEDLGSSISTVKAALVELENRLPQTDVWTEKLESLNRLAADLQQRLDTLQPVALPIGAPPEVTSDKAAIDQAAIREKITQIWWDIKSAVEEKVERLDGRKRRKYASISRYTYEAVADLLHEDNVLSRSQTTALKQADTKYRSLRNGRLAVSNPDLKSFQEWKSTLLDDVV